ncbi:MAG: hypothetical protein ABFD75_02725 [Smithella sp.]
MNDLIGLIIFLTNDIPNKLKPPPRPQDGIYNESFFESVKDNPYYDYGDTFIQSHLIPIALHAIYGPSFNKPDDCKDCIYRRFVCYSHEELKKKTCFECAQQAFIIQMSDIAAGKELKDFFSFDAGRVISDCLDLLLELSQDYIFTRVLISNGEVKKDNFIDISKFINPGTEEWDLGRRFTHFLFSLAGYSLINFLIKTDRRKLKKCPICNKFFIAEDTKRQRCYNKACDREYRRLQKQRQRREDPLKYV